MEKHIRTIKGVVQEIRKADPGSAISEYFIRQLCKSNAVPYRKAGAKYLLAVEDICDIFNIERR